MSEKNQQNFPHIVVILAVLLMITALLVIAGCLSPASENPPAGPATCSADTNICPVPNLGSIKIESAPQMYSPTMSSTIGIGLIPNVSGFNPEDAEFTWNATYGQFFDWSPPNYTISRLAQPVVNHGEKVYWSFTEAPASTRDPVIISVTARDLPSGRILGSSSLTLGWEGNFTVTVQKTA